MKFLKLRVIIAILLFLAIIQGALAEDATAPALPDGGQAVSEEQVKEKIKERLEKVAEQNLSEAKQELADRNLKKVYAVVGKIKSITSDNLIVQTQNGDSEVKVSSNAAMFKMLNDTDKKTIKPSDLRVDQFLLAMGSLNQKLLEARRLIISFPPTPSSRRVVWGKVVEVDDKKITYKNNSGQESITIITNTRIIIPGLSKSDINHIQIGDQLVAILDKDSKDQEYAKIIHISPASANASISEPSSSWVKTPAPKTQSSPSPSPKAK